MTAPDPNPEWNSTVANLAFRLLQPPQAGGYSPKELQSALEAAAVLLAEAVKPREQHACELFERDQVVGMHELAGIFDKAGWKRLKAPNSVMKCTNQLLELVHVDIEARRGFLAALRRTRLGNRHRPLAGETTAKEAVRKLLAEQGMDAAFEPNLVFAVEDIWQFIMERWVAAEVQQRENLAALPDINEAFFEMICPDRRYAEYLRGRMPPDGLNAERVFDIILWLNRAFSKSFCRNREDSLGRLLTLGPWLEAVLSSGVRFASPFGECVHVLIGSGTPPSHDLLAILDATVQRLCEAWATVKLRDFRDGIRPQLPIGEIDDLRSAWEQLSGEEQEMLSDRTLLDHQEVLVAVSLFINGNGLRFPAHSPVHGLGSPLPLLTPYLRQLDSLRSCIGALESLAKGIPTPCADQLLSLLRQACEEERKRIVEIGKTLADPDSQESAASLARAEELLNTNKRQTSPGQISAYELFRYAQRRGWLRDLLTRERPRPVPPKTSPPGKTAG